jgi:hypothetical protein
MALAHPITLLIGGLLLAAPILLHFLMQRKPKHIIFPALQFVRQRQSTNQRKLQLRHLLLLALRCLIILAVAAALAGLSAATNLAGAWLTITLLGLGLLVASLLLVATLLLVRPINLLLSGLLGLLVAGLLGTTLWLGYSAVDQGKDVVISNQREPVAAVLVIDTGPRMEYLFDNQTRLEKSQVMAQWVTRQLPLESQVAVCDSQTSDPVFAADVSAANKRVRALRTTYQPRALIEQVRKSIALVQNSPQLQREIYVFSDLSESAWGDVDREDIQRLLSADKSTHVYLIDVGVENPTNFSLGGIDIVSESIGDRTAVTLKTSLLRLGEADSRTLEVLIERQDDRLPVRRDNETIVPESDVVHTAEVRVDANGQTNAELVIAELTAGLHHGSIRIQGEDNLTIDDRRFFSIDVRASWPVLLAAPSDVYLEDVKDILANNRAASLEITSADLSKLSQIDLDEFAAVVLLDPGPLDESQWSQLHRFVIEGNSLAIFLGNNASDGINLHASFRSEIASQLIPKSLGNIWRADDAPVYLNPTSFSHPIVRPMQGYATTIPWLDFPIRRFWGFSRNPADEETEIVLELSNGRPAMIERRIDKGTILLMTTPVTEPFKPENRTRWNDLMIGGECWPTWWLIRNTSEHMLRNRTQRLNYLVSETAELDNDTRRFPDKYQIFPPMNEEPQRLIVESDWLRYPFLDKPGTYYLKGLSEQPLTRGFSANLPASATELNRLNKAQLDKIFGEDHFQLARDTDEIQRKQGAVRQGQEFYAVFILMLVMFFGLESIMANWFYKAKS